MRLAQRTFRNADQGRFASISGDYNPMHVDAVQARRTQAGAQVVHGVHLLLWALNSLAAAQADLPWPTGFRAQFLRFVYLDERAEVTMVHRDPENILLNISVDGALRSKVKLEFAGETSVDAGWAEESMPLLPFSASPLNLEFEQMGGRCGRLPFQMTAGDATALFPAAVRWLGGDRIAAMAATTYLVGMVCPGLHSIYRELSVGLCAEAVPERCLRFRVIETDARFRSVLQEIAGGGLTGTVKSYARVPPVRQASMESLGCVVGRTEFSGSVALIVGGSRGLGELTAKVIASGGGRVVVTWHSGKEDAERVAQEIRSAGGACETLRYDAREPAAEQLAPLSDAPTHAYYFATPAIFRPQAQMFVAGRLQEFLSVYVDGFWELSQALRVRQPGISVFYPSTVYVAELERGMTEYAMSKAAGEVLCAEMAASQPPMKVTVRRLPKLPTDQTASITGWETADPLKTMLPIIREVQSWPRRVEAKLEGQADTRQAQSFRTVLPGQG